MKLPDYLFCLCAGLIVGGNLASEPMVSRIVGILTGVIFATATIIAAKSRKQHD